MYEITLVSKNLEKFRAHKGLSIKDLCKSIGITPQAYDNYKNGKRLVPTNVVIKLQNIYGVNSTWLLTGEGEMFKSDGMNPEFIEKLKEDLKDKDDSFFASLSISKDKLFDVLFGKTKLTRVEVIELSRKLNKSLDEYIYLSGYMPPEFERILQKPRMLGALRTAGKLSDKDIDQAIEGFVDVLQQYEKRHKKP